MRTPVPSVVVIGVFGLNRDAVIPRVDLDLRLVQPLFRVGVLDRIDLDFVPIPTRDVDVAIDVIEFDSAIRSQSVGLMELLGQRAAVVGGVRS